MFLDIFQMQNIYLLFNLSIYLSIYWLIAVLVNYNNPGYILSAKQAKT